MALAWRLLMDMMLNETIWYQNAGTFESLRRSQRHSSFWRFHGSSRRSSGACCSGCSPSTLCYFFSGHVSLPLLSVPSILHVDTFKISSLHLLVYGIGDLQTGQWPAWVNSLRFWFQDLSGRPHLSSNLEIPTQRVGNFDTQVQLYFLFHSLSYHSSWENGIKEQASSYL